MEIAKLLCKTSHLQGAIKVTSSYDPLDLYSGDTGRMQRALLELLATPQNNLRLFVDGKAVEKFAEFEQPFAEALGLGESQEAFAQLLTHILQDSGTLPASLRGRQVVVETRILFCTLADSYCRSPGAITGGSEAGRV